MKTPWRFVADLVSRKPKPHGHDVNPAVEPKTIALEYKPTPDEEQAGREATTVDSAAAPSSEAQAKARPLRSGADPTEAATPSAAAKAPSVSVDVKEPLSLATVQRAGKTVRTRPRAEGAGTLVKPAPGRRKKVEPIVELAASIGTAIAPGPKPFTDEMIDLDAEVAALRRQLAKKLVEQNAQLRKMLARFGSR